LEKGTLHAPEGDPRTPYLVGFHISTILLLFRLWQRREYDLPEELFDLIYKLCTGGMNAAVVEGAADNTIRPG